MDNLEKYIVQNRVDFDIEVPSLKAWAHIEKRLDTEGGQEAALEQFIDDNRSAFDTEIPNLKVWAAVDKHINRTAEWRLVVVRWAQRAAAAVVLLVVGATVGVQLNEKREAIVVDRQMEEVVPNFKEKEKYYDDQVQAQLTKLANYNQQDPSVMMDLEQIDLVQQELRAELALAPSSTKEEIIRRMMENYQYKLDILERVLRPIETNHSDRNWDNSKGVDRENKTKNNAKKGQKHETI